MENKQPEIDRMEAKLLRESVNFCEAAYLLENGRVIQKTGGKWYVREYSPDEIMDSKWDVWCHEKPGAKGFMDRPLFTCRGAAACLCFQQIRGNNGFDTLEEAIAAGNDEHLGELTPEQKQAELDWKETLPKKLSESIENPKIQSKKVKKQRAKNKDAVSLANKRWKKQTPE